VTRTGDQLTAPDRRPALARVGSAVCRLTTVASLPLLVLGVRRLLQLERTSAAVAEQQSGETLVTVGAGMLLLGGVAWLLDRRRSEGSRVVAALAGCSVLWPAWIGFVHWYDAR
jgi:hypothetical protein